LGELGRRRRIVRCGGEGLGPILEAGGTLGVDFERPFEGEASLAKIEGATRLTSLVVEPPDMLDTISDEKERSENVALACSISTMCSSPRCSKKVPPPE